MRRASRLLRPCVSLSVCLSVCLSVRRPPWRLGGLGCGLCCAPWREGPAWELREAGRADGAPVAAEGGAVAAAEEEKAEEAEAEAEAEAEEEEEAEAEEEEAEVEVEAEAACEGALRGRRRGSRP